MWKSAGRAPSSRVLPWHFVLQPRKKHGKTSVGVRKTSVRVRKTSVRVRKTSVRLIKTSVSVQYTYYIRQTQAIWEYNIKMDLKEIGLEGIDLIHLTQDADSWRALVNETRNFWIHKRQFFLMLAQEQLACQAGPMLWS